MFPLIKAWLCPFLPLYFGGGGIGNKGPSSTTQNTTTNQTTNIDKRLVIGAVSTGVSADNSTVSLTSYSTDAGAIAGALQFAAHSVDLNAAEFSTATDLVKSSSDHAYDSLTQALGIADRSIQVASKEVSASTQAVAGAYQAAADVSTGNRFLIIGALAVVAVVGFAALKRA